MHKQKAIDKLFHQTTPAKTRNKLIEDCIKPHCDDTIQTGIKGLMRYRNLGYITALEVLLKTAYRVDELCKKEDKRNELY